MVHGCRLRHCRGLAASQDDDRCLCINHLHRELLFVRLLQEIIHEMVAIRVCGHALPYALQRRLVMVHLHLAYRGGNAQRQQAIQRPELVTLM